MKTIRARFVGGPWHNQIYEAPYQEYVFAPEPPPRFSLWEKLLFDFIGYKPPTGTSYRLCRFANLYGTEFLQFVHESRINAGKPDEMTCNEFFPRAHLDITRLELLAARWRRVRQIQHECS